MPLILRVDGAGGITEFSLNNVLYSIVSLDDAAESRPGLGRSPEGPINADPRVETITDMSYMDGKVLVGGLSNQDFSSDLRSIPFPFPRAASGTGIRIWHSAHARYETAAPVRNFVPYTIDNEQYILASCTCTPLVKIPVSAPDPCAKVVGETIAELGDGNQPLDMLTYRRNGRENILMANTTRGVTKLQTGNLGNYDAINSPTPECAAPVPYEDFRGAFGPERAACRGDIYGVPYETVSELQGVWQMSKFDDEHAVVLIDSEGSLNLADGQASAFTSDPGRSLDLMSVPLP